MIGVCSYLLIGYWSHRLAAVKSAQKAILVNRVSDGMLLWGILWIWYNTGTLEYDLILLNSSPFTSSFLGVAILIGAMGKSAQILFHVWLADAMEGKILLLLFYLICLLFYSLFFDDGKFDFIIAFCAVVTSNKKTTTTVSNYQQQAICGLLLSDGCVSDPNNRGFVSSKGSYRLEFTFKMPVLDFMKWLKFEVLGNLSTSTLPTPHPKKEPTQYWFSTSQSSYFTCLACLWYVQHPNPTPRLKILKVLPDNFYLEQQLTAVALAFWIMGDGYWENDSNTVYLCTESFTNGEVLCLMRLLHAKFGLVTTTKLRKGNYRIRFSSAGKNLDLLRSLVVPHMHSSMLYKLNIK